MPKPTRYKYSVANRRGTTLSKSTSYALTESDILRSGYSFIKVSANAYITLPAAADKYRGISIYVTTTSQGYVYVSGGFGGGGASKDTALIGKYETAEFWCDGSYWYAINFKIHIGFTLKSDSCPCWCCHQQDKLIIPYEMNMSLVIRPTTASQYFSGVHSSAKVLNPSTLFNMAL